MHILLKSIVIAPALLTLPAAAQERLFDLEQGDRARQGPVLDRLQVTLAPGRLIAGEEQDLVLPLPEGDLVVKLQPIPPRELALPEGQAAWTGVTQDGSNVFIMRIGNAIEAEIRRRSLIYRLRTVEGERGVLEVIDPRRFREAPNDGVVIEKDERPRPDEQPDSSCMDSADRVDVLVAYTPQARDGAGGTQQIENEIAFAIGRTNFAYANSNVFHRLNLVSVLEVPFNEPAAGVDSNALLGQLRDPGDMILDTIHGDRDGAKADLVSLIYEVDDSTWCGWGHLADTADADTTDDEAFSVVARDCASNNLSFPHEIGHNLGARHDRYSNTGTSDHDYNFGHVQMEPNMAGVSPWRTVMSYNAICDDNGIYCDRLAYFSNPNVAFSGDATGVPLNATQPEHNVNAFAQNDGEVSRYRCARNVDPVADVWMKDRWEDTGEEPDLATAGKPMWQSPYIWVRLTEDTTNEHAHEHENPVLGLTNHVYVKQHNDGSQAEAGTLELYFASASTNLNNPSNWTLIDTVSKTVQSGVDTSRFEWTGLPGTGHYCLMARWNTDGSPLSFSDIGGFVRGSNDVVWRNVNIMPLGGGDTESSFLMVGDRESRETFLLIENRPFDDRPLPWPKMVRLELQMDPELLGKEPVLVGVEPLGDGRFLLPHDGRAKVIGPLRLQPREQSEGTLRVLEDSRQIKQASAQIANRAAFGVTVSQIRPDGLQLVNNDHEALLDKEGLVLGGVSYTLQLMP